MIRISILVLILLGALSCKEVAADKKPTLDTVDSAIPENDPTAEEHKGEETTEPIGMAKDCNQTFDDFFGRFAKDSTFQKDRMKYPLKWSYYKDVTDETLTIEHVGYGSFGYVDFTKDEEAIDNEYDKYEVEIEKKENYNLYKLFGVDNGIHVTYKFNLIDGCWYLVEILDEST